MRALILWVAYQAFWFACVMGAEHGSLWSAPLALACFIPLRFIIGTRTRWREDLLHMLTVGALGFLVDSGFAATGLMSYAAPWPSAALAPLWIVMIWLAFALTLRDGLGFLHERPLLAGILGAVGAPLSYLGAARGFGVVKFPMGEGAALAALAVAWFIALPAAFMLMRLSLLPARLHARHLPGAR